MDGPPIRRVTFRVQHDCPLANLSRDLVGSDLRAWSGHHFEVVEVRAPDREDPVPAIRRRLAPLRVLPSRDRLYVVWRPYQAPGRSISRRLEAHQMMWLQPLRARDGWEHYDAIAFGESGEQGVLDEFRDEHPTQVVRRETIGMEDLTASLFLSLHPALDAPTDKQAEALLAAFRSGYYRTPRGTTTARLAASLGIGRSAFEERMRGGENRIMDAVMPALMAHRGASSPPPDAAAQAVDPQDLEPAP